MRKMKNSFKILSIKPGGRIPLWRHRRSWDNIIKMDLKLSVNI